MRNNILGLSIFALILAAIIFFPGISGCKADSSTPIELTKPHSCLFDDCKMRGNSVFMTDEAWGTDAYLEDLTHWNHPTWDADQIDNYLFGSSPIELETI